MNSKIAAAAVILLQNATFQAYLSPACLFTVYFGKLQGVAMAVQSTTLVKNQLFQKFTIFTNNQSAIQAVTTSSAQSGQQILYFIIGAINRLQDQPIEVEIQWIPAYIVVEKNKIADYAVKETTSQKKVIKRNRKSIEINISHTLPFSHLLSLRSAIKASLKEKLYTECEGNWNKENKSQILYKITAKLLQKVLHLYKKLSKQTSLLMVQMRMGKIGLKMFLYEQNVQNIVDAEYVCGEKEEMVRHVLTKCLHFSKLRRITWSDKVKKAR